MRSVRTQCDTWQLIFGAIALLALEVSSGHCRRRSTVSAGEHEIANVPCSPSKYGVLTSHRWSYGALFRKEDLKPVPNPNPHPEPQPHRDHPHGIAVPPDGTKVYITLTGNEAEPGNEVAVLDVASRKVVKRIRVGSSPWSLTPYPEGGRITVLNRFSNYASVIDTVKDQVVDEIALDFYCQDMVFEDGGLRAFISNRYLDQILVVERESLEAPLRIRPIGGFDDAAFMPAAANNGVGGIFGLLRASCGTMACHNKTSGGYYAGDDKLKAYLSAIEFAVPGDPEQSLLLRAVRSVEEKGFADDLSGNNFHAGGTVVWSRSDPAYQEVAGWIAQARKGPGISVGNPGSKPYSLAISRDGKHLYVGHHGTQEITIIDLERLEEVGAIHTQTLTTALTIYQGADETRELLIALSLGLGFGAARERDPLGGETEDPKNPAAQYTVLRDLDTTEPLPLDRQSILGPFDAVDGTAAIKMSDIQNDILVVDIRRLCFDQKPPGSPPGLMLLANRYEAHSGWVRYTSDSAEVLPQDFSGDIPPALQRVVGAFPEDIAIRGDRAYVVAAGSYELVEYLVRPQPAEASDRLEPLRVFRTGIMPQRVALGLDDTPSAGLAFVTNLMGETLSVIDLKSGTSVEVPVGDLRRPVPDTDAERGQMFVSSTVFSIDQDTACVSCHIYDTGDGRGWGAGQAIAQMKDGTFVNGGFLAIPQLRNLFPIQPFYFEGTHTAFDAQFDDAREHVALQGFLSPNPQGDFTSIYSPKPPDERRPEHEEIQDKMSTPSWGPLYQDLLERRDEMMRLKTMELFGKAQSFRDFQRFIGEYQVVEPRLMPNPFDQQYPSVARGRFLFNNLSVGCVVCHRPPNFTNKDESLTNNDERALPPLISFTRREKSFTLISPHYMDRVNRYRPDVEPWEEGRAERIEGFTTSFQLRGLFDRPFSFMHHGRALSLRETFVSPAHYSLRPLKYPPLRGGESIRPDGCERGFNETAFLSERSYMVDTHGGTSHLTARQVQDLENFLLSIE